MLRGDEIFLVERRNKGTFTIADQLSLYSEIIKRLNDGIKEHRASRRNINIKNP